MTYKLFLAALIAALSLGLAGCEKEGPMERAGEKLDEAAEEVKDAAEEAADEIKDATDQ